MKTEHESDSVFQALAGKHLDETISHLNGRIRHTQLECLENLFRQQTKVLTEFLDGIDDQLIKLSVYIEEYQRLCASLKILGENRIPELGGVPPLPPQVIAGDTLEAVLTQRIDHLKSQGRI